MMYSASTGCVRSLEFVCATSGCLNWCVHFLSFLQWKFMYVPPAKRWFVNVALVTLLRTARHACHTWRPESSMSHSTLLRHAHQNPPRHQFNFVWHPRCHACRIRHYFVINVTVSQTGFDRTRADAKVTSYPNRKSASDTPPHLLETLTRNLANDIKCLNVILCTSHCFNTSLRDVQSDPALRAL